MFTPDYVEKTINSKLLQVNTAYLGRVEAINGTTARVKPLTKHKAKGGAAQEQSSAPAMIPPNIKYKEEKITYLVNKDRSETKTILTPDNLDVGDIVFVGVCDRDITHAKNGVISEASNRHHNINDGVILRVVR